MEDEGHSLSPTEKTKEFKLEPDQELRFEVENDEQMEMKLVNGLAEMFGTELTRGKQYVFLPGAKVGIYTYHGCTIRIRGNHDTCYISKETPMIFYINLHGCFELQREAGKGPIVMLTGPTDVGKTTLARILLNYAVRSGRTPLYIDLDLGQGNIGIPGTIGSVLVERPADIETGFSQAAPLILHYGDTSPAANSKLYHLLVGELAKVVHKRMEEDIAVKHSGVIINTCGWITGGGYKSLLQIAAAFQVDVILAIDQEKLYNELVRDQPHHVKVIFTPKSGGVVVRSKEYRTEARENRIREYFYGNKVKAAASGGTQFYPHSFEVPFSQLKIFKIGAPIVPESCLPLGMKSDDNLTKLVPVQPSSSILHHLLSVTFTSDLSEILSSNVQGFICITNVDTERQTVTVISPQPRPLPSNCVLLLSNIQFIDSH